MKKNSHTQSTQHQSAAANKEQKQNAWSGIKTIIIVILLLLLGGGLWTAAYNSGLNAQEKAHDLEMERQFQTGYEAGQAACPVVSIETTENEVVAEPATTKKIAAPTAVKEEPQQVETPVESTPEPEVQEPVVTPEPTPACRFEVVTEEVTTYVEQTVTKEVPVEKQVTEVVPVERQIEKTITEEVVVDVPHVYYEYDIYHEDGSSTHGTSKDHLPEGATNVAFLEVVEQEVQTVERTVVETVVEMVEQTKTVTEYETVTEVVSVPVISTVEKTVEICE